MEQGLATKANTKMAKSSGAKKGARTPRYLQLAAELREAAAVVRVAQEAQDDFEATVRPLERRIAALDAGVERMLALTDLDGDTPFEVKRGVTRPVWEPDAGGRALLDLYEGLAKSIGRPFRHESSGGGSDGNFTGAMGIPTLDGLGVDGGGYHTLDEHIEIESLAVRGRLFAGMLALIS